MPGIIVIGAGAAGLSAALELADRGYKVTLIEQATLGFGSSGRNPGRMGHGFHYIDFDTAKMYLRASIQVQRKYPNYLIGKELPFSHPLRHGRYFITKDSDNPPEQILATYKKIQEEYVRLIEEDPANEVFGPPEHFFRILDPNEYESYVTPDIVAMGVETAEHLFDWQAFRADIRNKILAHPNITLYENTEITHIDRGGINKPRFSLRTKQKGKESKQEVILQTDYVVNSTWQNIEKLNAQVGLTMIPRSRTNRLKALLVVKLPDSLVQANSMFFCMGQHCMYSNLGNGYGMMTFANVTNVEASTGLTLSEHANTLLDGKVTQEEKDAMAQTMLKGVAHYIPEMAKATIVDVQYGIVQTAGALTLSDLRDPNSNFHRRDYDGIREEQIGLISNPCMKLFYFVRNGEVVADLIDAEIIATGLITNHMRTIEKQAKKAHWELNTDIKKTLKSTMEQYVSSTSLTSEGQETQSCIMFQTMLRKQAVTAELKQQFPPALNPSKTDEILPEFFMNTISLTPLKTAILILLTAKVTALIGARTDCKSIAVLSTAAVIGASLLARSFFVTKKCAGTDESKHKTPSLELKKQPPH